MSSETLRIQGNNLLKETDACLLPLCIKQSRYRNVAKLYSSALKIADGENEVASCWKNLAVANWRLAASIESAAVEMDLYVSYANQALECFIKCLSYKATKSDQWIRGIESQLDSVILGIESVTSSMVFEKRVSCLRQLSCKYTDTVVKLNAVAKLHFMLSRELFTSVHRDSTATFSFTEVLSRLIDSLQSLELARLYASQPETEEDIEDLKAQILFRQCTVQSVNARRTGDEILEKYLMETDGRNMDMVFTAIDKYKEAILLSREIDMEAEAIARCHMGRVFKRVLKLESEAKNYYESSIQLALSMVPNSETNTAWYREATNAVKEYQERLLLNDNVEQEKKKAPILQELKNEIAALEKVENDVCELLRHIYNAHPPPKEAKIGSLDKASVKKTLFKAITHYHPDRLGDAPEKDKLLFDEIVKRLNKFYSSMKLEDT